MTAAVYQRSFFADLDGKPLEGFAYVGIADMDPRTNPQQCYWDAACTIPATQPLRISAGSIVNTGMRAAVYVAEDGYSLRATNRAGVEVDYVAEVKDNSVQTNLALPTGSTLVGTEQTGTGAVPRTVAQKLNELPVSIRDYGAVCDGSTPDDDAILAAVSSGARHIYLPDGTTINAGSLTFNGINGLHFYGDGLEASTLHVLGGTGPFAFQFINSQDVSVEGLGIVYAAEQTAGWAVIFQNCFEPTLNVFIQYHFNGVWMQSGSELSGYVRARYAFGTYGVLFGSSTAGVYGSTLRYHGDNPPAVGVTGVFTYAPNTAVTVGQLTAANSAVYVCTQAGTTGASSTPSGTSGSAFANNITDGTAAWRFAYSITLTHVAVDSNAHSIRLEKSFGLNGAYAFRAIDSLNTGSSYPTFIYLGLEADHNFEAGYSLEAGEAIYGNDNAWVGSCLAGNGIQVIGAFKGEFTLPESMRCFGNAQHGLLINAGRVFDIKGMYSGNSHASNGTYHGICIGSGVTDFLIDATCGINPLVGATQGYGVFLTGSNDHYDIGGNLLGNVNGAISGHVRTLNKIYRAIPSLEQRGLLKIPSGQISADFTHGLGVIPPLVIANPRNDLTTARSFKSNFTPTVVTINLSSALTYDMFFDMLVFGD